MCSIPPPQTTEGQPIFKKLLVQRLTISILVHSMKVKKACATDWCNQKQM